LLTFEPMKWIKTIFIGFLTIALFSSCTLERKLAMEFVQSEAPSYPVMLVPPDILYTFNLKAPPVGDYEDVDSALFFSSKYIQYVSDSAFLENYFSAFIEQSQKNKLAVYFPEDLDSFLIMDRAAYIVRFAQMELAEDTASMRAEEKINNRPKDKDIPYHFISLSTWFEISMKDSLQGYTYFDEQYLAEEIYGDFIQESWSLDYKYEYELFDLEKEDIYSFARYMGQTHSEYLFDLMLNSYIWNHLPKDRRKSFLYLHYNSRYHSIEVAEEAFILMDEE